MKLPRLLRTTSFRLAALYLLLFGGSVLALAAVVRWTVRAALEQQMRGRIEAEAATLQVEAREGGAARVAALVAARGRGARALDFRVEAADGRVLAGDLPSPGGRDGWVELGAEEPRRTDGDGGLERIRALAVPLEGGGRLLVGDDLDRLDDVDEAILRAFGWALALTVALGVGGGLLLGAGFLRRVDAITRTAEAIVEGDLARRVPDRGTHDDLDRLARALNHMLDRIAALMEGLRQVSSDVAHELRTPLSRLRQRLEAARAGARSDGEWRAAVEEAIGDTDQVLGIFAALLRIAQIEAGTRRAGFRALDLREVASGVAEAFAPSAEEAGRPLSLDAPEPVPAQGDRELLTQMLANLVDNALRHTPPGTRIVLSAAATPGGARLAVADDGPGVPAEERERIFRRLHRLERSRSTPGSGLGLALVAAVAELHGARIAAEDAEPGLRVVVDLPPDRP